MQRFLIAYVLLLALHLSGYAAAADLATNTRSDLVPLGGHVLPALASAVPSSSLRVSGADAQDADLALTVVLRRTDPAGFQAYLQDVYNADSQNFRKFLTVAQLAERFGPSAQDYQVVSDYFTQQGFAVVERSANRMTLTVKGSRAVAAQALSVNIRDYRIGEQVFYANDSEPLLPAAVAARVEAVVGLSNLAMPRPVFGSGGVSLYCILVNIGFRISLILSADADQQYSDALSKCRKDVIKNQSFYVWLWQIKDPPPPAWQGVDGTGQTVGLVALSTFQMSDVVNFTRLLKMPASVINNVSNVHVGGGATSSGGSGESEVLLDIDTVITTAPGAHVVVFDGPFSGAGSFQAIFNAMINANVTVISNSFAYCEDQTTASDVQSIESVLQTAAGAGISVVSASGDHGSTCLDGAANTLHVPANVPHITAVGGTSITYGPGQTYGSETWWNGAGATPTTGQGGFGTSRFFARPSYQNALNTNPMRSIPDVAINADPATTGVEICQASAGGCPTGLYFGGTSVSAPTFAAYVALLNQAQGSNLGFLNPSLYPLAATQAFHGPASMGSDFAHVGLGSPNVNLLHQRLTNQVTGSVDADISEISASYVPEGFPLQSGMPLPGDGTSQIAVTVRLSDGNGNYIGGKSVQLAGNAGNHAVITPASAITDAITGAAVFTLKDPVVEALTLTATDVTDNVVLNKTFNVNVVVPPAAGGGISAAPNLVLNDGVATTTITVILRDAQNQPSPGKLVTLSQGSGHSVITGPSPSVTDATGTIQFTATDQVPETVTYTAIDVSDGSVPIPGTAPVTFSGQANASCVTAPPTAAAGYTMSPYSTGYPARNFFYSGINFGGCGGASNPAFDAAGNTYVGDGPDGKLYKLGPGGGVASNANVLVNLGPSLNGPVFGTDGSLYVSRTASGGGLTSGLVLQIDPVTGATIRTVASNVTCPGPLAVDPLSGDLFFTDICFGAGLENSSLFRIAHPNSATPTLSTYATLPGAPNGTVAIAPNGTMYVSVNYTSTDLVVRVSGTNSSPPPVVTTLSGISTIYWVTIGEVLPGGAAKSLIVLGASGLNLVDLTTNTVTPLTNGQISSGTIGPDGCLYTSGSDTIYRLAPAAGACTFSVTNPSPLLTLTPAIASPNPAQGTAQTLTARFTNVSVPQGTPVTFTIFGPNVRTILANTDANGAAAISYVGVMTGTDLIEASGVAGTSTLNSPRAQVTWVAGKHVTFLDLASSPSSSIAGAAVTLGAALSDLSQTPQAVIAGATIQFSLGGQTCNGVTNASGVASCTLTPAPGQYTLIATYAGSAQYVAASVSQQFAVLAAAPAPAPGIVYVPLEPCRIMDTRNATVGSGVGGPITGNVLYNVPGFINAGQNWAQYGGSAATDCGLTNPPGGSIHAVALVASILNPNFDAYLGISDSNVLGTVLSNVALNYTHGQGLSTMYIVPQILTNNIYFAMPAGLSAQLIFDVVGYFVVGDATALQCTTQASVPSSIAAGGTGTATSSACAAGYTLASGSCDATSSSLKLSKHEAAGGNTTWLCAATNGGGVAANLTATATCCRVPGK